MKISELFESKFVPEIGKCYRLRDKNGTPADKKIGDFAGLTVFVEKGPRNEGEPSEQY